MIDVHVLNLEVLWHNQISNRATQNIVRDELINNNEKLKYMYRIAKDLESCLKEAKGGWNTASL